MDDPRLIHILDEIHIKRYEIKKLLQATKDAEDELKKLKRLRDEIKLDIFNMKHGTGIAFGDTFKVTSEIQSLNASNNNGWSPFYVGGLARIVGLDEDSFAIQEISERAPWGTHIPYELVLDAIRGDGNE